MDSTAKHRIAIILVNWNGLDFTVACLQSLRKVDFKNFSIILVDNASENQEGSIIQKLFPEIELVQSDSNRGFAGGNNLGIRKALEGDFTHLMLLNNDTVVAPNFLKEMVAVFDKDIAVGVVQPLIYWMKDRNQIWSAGGIWNELLGRSITQVDIKTRGKTRTAYQKLDWATGCCMLISRETILATGLLNEQFFAYFEDVDWSLRFRKQGFEIALAPEAVIYHEAGASSKKKHSEGILSPRVFYYHVRNQFFIIRTAVRTIYKPFAIGYHLFRFGFWMGYFAIRGRFKKLKSVAKGIRDGITKPIQLPEKWL
jgi:GT2 family glycosyltransferase